MMGKIKDFFGGWFFIILYVAFIVFICYYETDYKRHIRETAENTAKLVELMQEHKQ